DYRFPRRLRRRSDARKTRASQMRRPRQSSEGGSSTDALRDLRAIYAEVDALTKGWSCDASTDCCRFGVTGREPYPTAVELAELAHGVAAHPLPAPKRRGALPVLDADAAKERRCPLLSESGRCRVYASRPFGCRTFFCDRAD